MTNEELASLEPIIAQAWDQWDRQRRLHYAQQAQAAAGAGKPPDGQPLGEVAPLTYAAAVDLGDAQTTAQPFPPPDPNQHSTPQANNFRARFHRSLVTPSLCPMFHCPPFRCHYRSLSPASSCLTSSCLSSSFARHPATSVSGPPAVSASPPTTLASPSPVTVLLTTAASLLLTVAVSAPIPASRFSLQPSAILRARALKRTERVEAEKRTEAVCCHRVTERCPSTS
ncbi:hypothetical protein F5148DRAFT_169170 [Russula earlei]|uniref:Uncharacterized protein n=1 Tax=Russula earlei TaxID=71964 RepID=A0ACC0TRZ7_9AGAM|nr:hypothetical protein F5148DRAFT_169170 [Russula earlei]